MRRMTIAQIIDKLKRRTQEYLSPERNFRRLAYSLDAISLRRRNSEYRERSEFGPSNLAVKLERQASGGPFEPLDIQLVNRAAGALAGNPSKVLEMGSGTGMFATFIADAHPNCVVIASEFHDATREWAAQNRDRPNISYCKSGLEDFSAQEFDLVVALEVVEHLKDYSTFLAHLSALAPRAIVSTPNKLRNAFDSIANPPYFEQHVREWSSEAFYWVLRVFWDKVQLFTVPDMQAQMTRLAANATYRPTVIGTGLHCRDHALIAVCEAPRNPVRQRFQ